MERRQKEIEKAVQEVEALQPRRPKPDPYQVTADCKKRLGANSVPSCKAGENFHHTSQRNLHPQNGLQVKPKEKNVKMSLVSTPHFQSQLKVCITSLFWFGGENPLMFPRSCCYQTSKHR